MTSASAGRSSVGWTFETAPSARPATPRRSRGRCRTPVRFVRTVYRRTRRTVPPVPNERFRLGRRVASPGEADVSLQLRCAHRRRDVVAVAFHDARFDQLRQVDVVERDVNPFSGVFARDARRLPLRYPVGGRRHVRGVADFAEISADGATPSGANERREHVRRDGRTVERRPADHRVEQRDDWVTYLVGEDVPNDALGIEVDVLQPL
jgi:hypothetical protein